MTTTPTSRQRDNSYALDRVAEAIRLACANSKRDLCKDPIPEYMNPPWVFDIYHYHNRIWRAPAIVLTKDTFRRCVGLLEFTPLNEPDALPLVLEWLYSADTPPEWSEYPYVIYTWFPGPQPCMDLVDVYHSCSLEIRWVIIHLLGREGLQQYRLQHKNKNGGPSTRSHEGICDAETGERIA